MKTRIFHSEKKKVAKARAFGLELFPSIRLATIGMVIDKYYHIEGKLNKLDVDFVAKHEPDLDIEIYDRTKIDIKHLTYMLDVDGLDAYMKQYMISRKLRFDRYREIDKIYKQILNVYHRNKCEYTCKEVVILFKCLFDRHYPKEFIHYYTEYLKELFEYWYKENLSDKELAKRGIL